MLKLFKKKFTTLIKPIPSPPVKSGILGMIMGHMKEIKDITKINGQNFGMGIYLKCNEWYKITNSKTVLLNLLGNKLILCADPKIYKEILGSKQDSFTNSIQIKKVMGYYFRTSMIVVDGEQWHRIRKVVQRAMNRKSLDPLVGIMCDTITKLFANSNVNEKSTLDLTSRITFDSFHRVFYGWDPASVEFSKESSELLDNCNIIAESIGKRGFYSIPFLWKLPTKENKKLDTAAAKIKNFVNDFVDKHRKILNEKMKDSKYAKSLLDEMIISSESGEEGGMTNEELVDQISTLFFGAYDTTANTLQFFLNYLARYPEVQEKLRNDIYKKYPYGLESLKTSKLIDVESIDYLNYFVDEVHRLHALVPFFGRDCIKDVIIGDYKIKKDTRIIIDTRTVGSESCFWNGQNDLDKFRPERWSEFKPSTLESVLPFGFGGRICIGRKIALSEMKVFLAAVLCNYRVNLRNPNENMELDLIVGLNMKPGNGNINFTKI